MKLVSEALSAIVEQHLLPRLRYRSRHSSVDLFPFLVDRDAPFIVATESEMRF
jgi:hypothetical protein